MKGEKQREGEREREEAENVGKAGGARREEEGGRREREICTQERTREKERVTACNCRVHLCPRTGSNSLYSGITSLLHPICIAIDVTLVGFNASSCLCILDLKP